MNHKEKNEVLKLLPWYQLGKLNKEDTLRVEAALAKDSALKEELELEKKLAGLVSAQPELLGGSSLDTAQRLEGLLPKLEDTPAVRVQQASQNDELDERQGMLGSLRDKLNELLFGNAQDFNYAMIAAIIAVNAAVLGVFMNTNTEQPKNEGFSPSNVSSSKLSVAGDKNGNYEGQTLWLQTSNPIDITDQLNLNSIVGSLGLESALGEGGARVAVLPAKGSLYRIRLNKPMKKASLEKIVNELQKMPGIEFVAKEFKKNSN